MPAASASARSMPAWRCCAAPSRRATSSSNAERFRPLQWPGSTPASQAFPIAFGSRPVIANADALLRPLTIKGLTIRNRVMSTSHAPGYGRDGKPQERYQLYHAEKAKGGIGLTMFGGSSSVAVDSPAAPWNQISVADDSVIPFFRQFSDR